MELNKIYNGDCLDLMKDIPDGSIDMILCDLPYGTTENKWDSVIPFEKLWENYSRIIKENGSIVLTSAQPFTTDLINSNRKIFRYELIWEKSTPTGFLNANKMPLRAHENILVFYKKLPTYNPQKIISNSSSVRNHAKDKFSKNYGKQMIASTYGSDDNTRFPRSVIMVKKDPGMSSSINNTRINPTQKPVALFEWLIKTYTNDNDTVLDNCSGSGTTAIACINTGRNFICIEKDEQYYNDSLRRLNKHKTETLTLS